LVSKDIFRWQAFDAHGQQFKGVLAAKAGTEVVAELRARGLYPVSVERRWSFPDFLMPGVEWGGFARRLGTLLEAGIPLVQALEILIKSEVRARNKAEWRRIKEAVEAGGSLSEAVSHSSWPPTPHVEFMLQAGERTGNLAQALSEVAFFWDKREALARKIRTAVMYPSLLLAMVVGLLYVLGVFVLPPYEQLFAGINADLPWLTRVIFDLGRRVPILVSSGGLFLTLAVLVLRLRYRGGWRWECSKLLGAVPVLGRIFVLGEFVQFSNLMGSLLQAGIPLLEALQLAVGALRYPPLRDLGQSLILAVRQGHSFLPLLQADKQVSPMAAAMLAVGEESGCLDAMFGRVAEMLSQELDDKLQRMARIVEPSMVVILAGIIGIVAMGVLLPVFEASMHLQA